LASKYGDSPAVRRIDIDVEELEFARGVSPLQTSGEKIPIPDTRDVDEEGVGGQFRG
jgi:hypothetical protein